MHRESMHGTTSGCFIGKLFEFFSGRPVGESKDALYINFSTHKFAV